MALYRIQVARALRPWAVTLAEEGDTSCSNIYNFMIPNLLPALPSLILSHAYSFKNEVAD